MPHLSARERDVAQLLLQGFAAKRIANELKISVRTVKAYKHVLFVKFGVDSSDKRFMPQIILASKLFEAGLCPCALCTSTNRGVDALRERQTTEQGRNLYTEPGV